MKGLGRLRRRRELSLTVGGDNLGLGLPTSFTEEKGDILFQDLPLSQPGIVDQEVHDRPRWRGEGSTSGMGAAQEHGPEASGDLQGQLLRNHPSHGKPQHKGLVDPEMIQEKTCLVSQLRHPIGSLGHG